MLCEEQCQVPCHPTRAQDGKTLFFCQKLRPVKSPYERSIGDGSWIWLVCFGGPPVVVVALLVICGCLNLAYDLCHKAKPSTNNPVFCEPLNGESPHAM